MFCPASIVTLHLFLKGTSYGGHVLPQDFEAQVFDEGLRCHHKHHKHHKPAMRRAKRAESKEGRERGGAATDHTHGRRSASVELREAEEKTKTHGKTGQEHWRDDDDKLSGKDMDDTDQQSDRLGFTIPHLGTLGIRSLSPSPPQPPPISEDGSWFGQRWPSRQVGRTTSKFLEGTLGVCF